MRGHIPVILAIALVVAGGCVNRQAQQQAGRTEKILRDPTIPVNVVSVDTRTIEEHLEITGEVTSGQDSSIGAKVGGRITAVYVREGDAVAAGQTIANMAVAIPNVAGELCVSTNVVTYVIVDVLGYVSP